MQSLSYKLTKKVYKPAAVGTALLAVLLSYLVGLQPASSQETGSVTVDVESCVALESAEARLACFGSRVDAALDSRDAARSGQDTAVIEDPESDRDRSADQQDLTRRERRLLRSAESAAESRDVEAAIQSGTIVAIRERLPQAYLITLDNGQIWEQTIPKAYPLRPGLEVTIRPSRWGGSYRLRGAGAGGYIQVRRVQ